MWVRTEEEVINHERIQKRTCIPFTNSCHPYKASTHSNPSSFLFLGNLTTCQGTQLDCAFKIFDDPNHYNESAQQCLAPCNDQVYDSRITLAMYPNRAMFSKRPEICNLVRKLLKICQGWVDPHAVGAYGQYGDELKIKKNVLLSAYPNMCKHLCEVFGFDAMVSANLTCNDIRRNLLNAANRYTSLH